MNACKTLKSVVTMAALSLGFSHTGLASPEVEVLKCKALSGSCIGSGQFMACFEDIAIVEFPGNGGQLQYRLQPAYLEVLVGIKTVKADGAFARVYNDVGSFLSGSFDQSEHWFSLMQTFTKEPAYVGNLTLEEDFAVAVACSYVD